MEEFSKGKACGACGVLKSKDEYSKAQWNPKKKTRRCKDCVEQDLPLQHTAKTDNNKFLEEKKEASLLDDSTDNIATGVGSDEKRTEPEEVETNGEANEQENSEETNVENQKSPKDPTATEVPKEQNNSDELSGKGEEQSLAEETYGKKAKTDEDEEKDPKDKSEQSSEDKKPQGDSESQKVDSEEAPAIQTSEDAGEKIITETDEKKEEELGGFVEEVKDEAPTAESPTAGDSTIQTLETPTPSTDAGTFKKTRVSDIASAYLPSSSPSTPPRTSVSKIDIECMPNIGSIREKFELSSRSSDFNIEFGEALRQKIREAQLMDKEKRKEAFSAIRRYKNAFDGIERDDGEIDGSHTQYGEIDESHLPSTFMFEGTSEDHLELHDGTCKVDYENADYNGLIFVVHRTRGNSPERFSYLLPCMIHLQPFPSTCSRDAFAK